MRNTKQNITLFLKGMGMGAADVVPGVSGGTIAFISGIYEELLETIGKVNFNTLKLLKTEGVKSFWAELNGNFLVILLAGVATSIITLASLIKHLLKNEPILIWSFFFGLILASIWLVGKQISKWNPITIISLVIGTIIAYYITLATPTTGSESLLYIFICGCIAITAMILPGISGSFILLLLGAYSTILSTISDITSGTSVSITASLMLLGIFGLGCITGLLSFSKLLNWLFKKAHNIIIAILTGFLIGSLNKVWPWKNTLEWFTKHKGEANEELIPLVQQNISPINFGEENQLIPALLLGTFGLVLILILDRFSPDKK